jgi:hypothetical protein
MALPQLSKLMTGVRFPLPAPPKKKACSCRSFSLRGLESNRRVGRRESLRFPPCRKTARRRMQETEGVLGASDERTTFDSPYPTVAREIPLLFFLNPEKTLLADF